MAADLELRGSGPLESRTVTVCSGLDLVNISYNNFVAPNESVARVTYFVQVLTCFLLVVLLL